MSVDLLSPGLRRPQRLTLVLLVALFLLPLVVGTGLFWLDWRPSASTEHGDLVQPPRPLPETGLQAPDGARLATARGKWLIVVPAAAACDAGCIDRLQRVMQVHGALGKEQSRVQPVLIAGVDGGGNDAGVVELAELGARFAALAIARVASDEKDAWRFALGQDDQAILIVDPFGNVMLHYRANSNPRGVLKDIERLLKYSWVR